jgi:hypothetical protein
MVDCPLSFANISRFQKLAPIHPSILYNHDFPPARSPSRAPVYVHSALVTFLRLLVKGLDRHEVRGAKFKSSKFFGLSQTTVLSALPPSLVLKPGSNRPLDTVLRCTCSLLSFICWLSPLLPLRFALNQNLDPQEWRSLPPLILEPHCSY